jgi:hypothetical protein
MLALALVAACSDAKVVNEYPDRGPGGKASTPYESQKQRDDSIFGPGGLSFGGNKPRTDGDQDGSGGLAVNSFLWRASLDTVAEASLPVASADPFGGVILTDWHAWAEAPNERFKLNIFVLGRSLRADGVRVAAFRQVREGGAWVDAAVEDRVPRSIEDAILLRARELRFAALSQ